MRLQTRLGALERRAAQPTGLRPLVSELWLDNGDGTATDNQGRRLSLCDVVWPQARVLLIREEICDSGSGSAMSVALAGLAETR
ncbi:MAG: hypothetical protein IT330_17325 [Anaerolineae bacterium]|nr:hypothetical protein [Anaerolineae bacterium]